MALEIFTIGHSNQEVDSFLQRLTDNSIQVVVDVRSAPYSRYVPQYNKKDIEAVIITAGFKYIFMGDLIGGKPSDPQYLNNNGKVNYAKLADSDKFQQGLNRLNKGLYDGWMVALMCAEEDPFACHRHLLIANELELRRNIAVWHIRANGSKIRARQHLEEYSGQLRLF